jgi:hypothetical protein
VHHFKVMTMLRNVSWMTGFHILSDKDMMALHPLRENLLRTASTGGAQGTADKWTSCDFLMAAWCFWLDLVKKDGFSFSELIFEWASAVDSGRSHVARKMLSEPATRQRRGWLVSSCAPRSATARHANV